MSDESKGDSPIDEKADLVKAKLAVLAAIVECAKEPGFGASSEGFARAYQILVVTEKDAD